MAQEKGQVLLEKNKTSRASPRGNPNSVSNVDAAQGPRTGNAGSAAKRAVFVKEKASSNNEKSALAAFVMDALAGRGAGMKPYIDPTVENINGSSSKSTGISRNPTAGGTHYRTTAKR
jgi:hypothetical protein